jgi:DNA modification methylase
VKIDEIYTGDAAKILAEFPDETFDCCVTSPPYYGLRDYGIPEQFGLENTLREYLEHLTSVFKEVKRVLKKNGTFWLNIGDCYAGSNQGSRSTKTLSKTQRKNKGCVFMKQSGFRSRLEKVEGCKPKDLIGIPWWLAFELRNNLGFYLRQDVIWAKPNPMVESIKDRCTRSHEYIFLLAKSKKYYFDHEAIKEKAVYDEGFRNKRDVWNIAVNPYRNAHCATFPEKLIEPCILASCPENGVVLDPFFGSGTVGKVAKKLNRNFVGIEINPSYCEMAKNRIFGGI